MYDAIVVGSGLYGSIIANRLHKENKRVLVVDRRNHIGGNLYTEIMENIPVHMYGAHIFRTNELKLWNWLSERCEMIPFINSPIANYNGELYNLPFNMNTFHQLWGVNTPDEAKAIIDAQRIYVVEPKNLEEFVLSKIGTDVYYKLIKDYTEKQWGKSCKELPATIMSRIPYRFTFDNNYYQGKMYQGVAKNGYTELFNVLLDGIEIQLGIDGRDIRKTVPIYYTGCIDEFYDYRFGRLEYRSLKFKTVVKEVTNYQGVAVMNFTDDTPYTRCIEHKHFYVASPIDNSTSTIISYEYPQNYIGSNEPYYPMTDENNRKLYYKYLDLANRENPNIRFCGRLGSYKYSDMEETISEALDIKL